MPEVNKSSEVQPTPTPEKGFVPETTEEIIDDLTPKEKKESNSLLKFLKKNALRLAPLALLASASFGHAAYDRFGGGEGGYEGSAVTATIEDGELSEYAKYQQENFQTTNKKFLDKIKRENLEPAFSMNKGFVVGFDKEGNPLEKGTVGVKAFPAEKYGDGTKVPIIARLPIGTEINGKIITESSYSKNDAIESYLEFSCDDVEGDFLSPKVEEKVIQLDENTICVVPWMNIVRN